MNGAAVNRAGAGVPGAAGTGAVSGSAPVATATSPWRQVDGTPIDCREKLRVLEENHAELAQVMQDAFEDAVLMGVDEAAMREHLAATVRALRSPKRG